MTIHEQAYKDVEKEIQESELLKIKVMMKDILQKIQEQKEKKESAEESLRILKLDLDDLRLGKLEKIKERHRSEKVSQIIPIRFPIIDNITTWDPNRWFDFTSGNYNITCQNGAIKTFYL